MRGLSSQIDSKYDAPGERWRARRRTTSAGSSAKATPPQRADDRIGAHPERTADLVQ
jgi:hypothetical protein